MLSDTPNWPCSKTFLSFSEDTLLRAFVRRLFFFFFAFFTFPGVERECKNNNVASKLRLETNRVANASISIAYLFTR